MITCLLSTIRRLLPATFAVAVALGLAACGKDVTRSENPPTVVEAETVALAEYASAVRLTGEIRAQVESDLSFRVGGRISERLVDVGDHVTADQVIARLDPEQQQATVTAAEAAVRAAEAVLSETTSTFERQKDLLAKGFTTRRDYDRAEEAYLVARATLDSATAQFGTARDQLSDTVLRAGASGIITARNAETGEVVQAGQAIFTIAHDGPRDAVFQVPESIFNRELGEPTVELTLISNPDVQAAGVVRELSPTVDALSGTVRVKVGIDHPPAAMTLGAAVVGESRPRPSDLIVIPWSALSSAGGQPAAWTIEPQTRRASLTPITIEAYESGKVIVRDGLRPGDIVVTAGAQVLRPGQVVELSEGTTL